MSGGNWRDEMATNEHFSGPLKPPLGIKPTWIWKHERIIELIKAVARYEEAGFIYPDEWIPELGELIVSQQPKKETK